MKPAKIKREEESAKRKAEQIPLIKELRAAGYTLRELQKYLGYSNHSSVAQLENGKTAISESNLKKLRKLTEIIKTNQ